MRPREPMRDLAAALTRVSDSAEAVRQAERDLEERRRELREALRQGRALGLTLAQLGKAAGVSRQRVAQLLD